MALTTKERRETRAAVGNKCTACGAPEFILEDGRSSLHVHHCKRVKEGGGDEPENRRVLCPKCHSEQHSDLRPEAARKSSATKQRKAEEQVEAALIYLRDPGH